MILMTGDLRPRRIAWAAELTALTLSVAANVAATIDGGVIGVVAGAATPLLLVLAVYLWRAFPGAAGWQRRLATVAMACVLGPVAVASYVHIADVVYESGAFARWLSWVIPLSVDGLAVRAALALWSPVRGRAPDIIWDAPSVESTNYPTDSADAAPVSDQTAATEVDESEPVSEADIISILHPEEERASALLESNPDISIRALADKLDCSKHRAGQYKKLWMGEAG